MIHGFYGITFTGVNGSGFGMLAFHAGTMAGADVTGVIFDGSYAENATKNGVNFRVTMRAPAGATIVQTGLPLTAPASIAITGSVLEADIASGRPVRLETEIGPVNIILRLIRDF